jgi:hypothetical protein
VEISDLSHIGGIPTPPPTFSAQLTSAARRRVWTKEAVLALGTTTDVETAAEIIGIGRSLAYELIAAGDFPIDLLRLGRRVLIPVHGLLSYLRANG